MYENMTDEELLEKYTWRLNLRNSSFLPKGKISSEEFIKRMRLGNIQIPTDEDILDSQGLYLNYLRSIGERITDEEFLNGIYSGKYNPEEYKINEDYLKYHEKHIYDYSMQSALNKNPDPIINTNAIVCPYCGSSSTEKISTTSRLMSTAFLGFGSSKIGKQWHCTRCKSNF